MKLFKVIILLAGSALLSLSTSFGQQVPQYSQYIFNPVFINPAYAGYKQQLYLQSYYRKQWTGVTGSPETFAVAGDTYLEESQLGVGGQFLTDKLGAQRTVAAYGNLAYHLRLSDTQFLSFGVGAGVVNSQIDGSMLNPDISDDPSIPGSMERMTYPDLKLGLFFYDDKYYLGVAADQMLSGVVDFDKGDIMVKPDPHIYLTGGYHFDLNYNFSFIPSIMYMDDFKAPARMDINGAFILNDMFWLGAGYRFGIDMPGREIEDGLKKSAAVLGMVQVQLKEGLRIGYAYDHTISGFSVGAFSTHDISIAFLFPPKRVRLVSPRFF
ncbi:type IX secretion system membrane protein, PorP/SprF family [Algoriphagus locisalis]|uniref:Type IX secretion system membrane protein, PorP/SprF family n=1 Tax=Algoriphagus locisalis TaxID=305507 RepID=A0A1I7E8N4_9BACT|nr:type IX secretion system membrane protein PorP/SprF [Algoriphagus locisalis]SFU20297.1 type IX secretion system membrane protein, PorP/SprF family [Algoriphagus locisalis]